MPNLKFHEASPLDQRFLSSFLSYDAEDSGVRRAKGTSAIITISTRHHIDTPPDFVLRLPGVQDIVKKIGIVSNYSSSIPKSTRHETLLINSPHGMPASQAYTVWDQVLNILLLMNCCKESAVIFGGSFYLHWLPEPSHRHHGCVNAFKTLTAWLGYFVINMKGTKTGTNGNILLDYVFINCSGDFYVSTVESLKNFMDEPDHRLIAVQARLRLMDDNMPRACLSVCQMGRAAKFLVKVEDIHLVS